MTHRDEIERLRRARTAGYLDALRDAREICCDIRDRFISITEDSGSLSAHGASECAARIETIETAVMIHGCAATITMGGKSTDEEIGK